MIVEEDNAIDTYIKSSSIDGNGLFATKAFQVNEIVLDYRPYSSNWYKLKWKDLSSTQISKNWYIYIDDEFCLTTDKISKFSYINHSRTPNCTWLIDSKIIIAYKSIAKDEELFIDYRLEKRPSRTSYPDWI
jgi:SET domain-containing protein